MEKIEIASRCYFSIQHIQSAALFARLSYAIEKNFDGNLTDELMAKQKAFVTGSIFAAVSYLEATINEFFEDTVTGPNEHLTGLAPDSKSLVAKMWKLEVAKTAQYAILEKYDIALTLARKSIFPKGVFPCQDVRFLISLRNILIHYEPKTSLFSSEINPKLVDRNLENKFRGRFKFNPLLPRNPFFPDRCLSHGCAEWSVNCSLALVDDFYSRMGITSPFHHVRSRLATK